MRLGTRHFIVMGLTVHTVMLLFIAARHSPVVDEVGHFPAGWSHWCLRRFDLYNVNPPLVRLVATLATSLRQEPPDFTRYQALPRIRSEFVIGRQWMTANPKKIIPGYRAARWACLPFALLGAMTCFFWARDLYGDAAGRISIGLWCFSPTVLGHASLMTPDAGAAAIGIAACYAFSRWLKRPALKSVILAGAALGLVLLTKFTWLVLLVLWPMWWLTWRLAGAFTRNSPEDSPSEEQTQRRLTRPSLKQLGLIFLLGWWILNNGYLWEDSFQPLGEFQFSSEALGKPNHPMGEQYGNRFRGTMLEYLPFPGPRNFLQGIDHIKFEYERGYSSYLRGETKHGGWWYYYLYAMLVKMPVGTLALLGISFGLLAVKAARSITRHQESRSKPETLDKRTEPLIIDEFFLLAPAVAILVLVSSETGFNHHLRYVLPAFPFLFIFAGRTALLFHSRRKLVKAIPLVCVLATVASSLSVYPHSLSYFNELSGGSINGWRHLDQSNVDWGQDLLYAKEWSDAHPEARPLYVAATGYVDPKLLGIPCEDARLSLRLPSKTDDRQIEDFPPGWYILGLTQLVNPANPIHCFLQEEPVGYIGYSMRVYHIPERKVPKEK